MHRLHDSKLKILSNLLLQHVHLQSKCPIASPYFPCKLAIPMSSPQPLPVNTASHEQSVWRDTDQYIFRQHILDLQQACKETPGDPKLHVLEDWHRRRSPSNDHGRFLPFEVEERLSNDFAFLMANQKDAKTVSAVALEEIVEPPGLIARIAANGAVQEGVVDSLQAIFNILGKCANRRALQFSKEALICSLLIPLRATSYCCLQRLDL